MAKANFFFERCEFNADLEGQNNTKPYCRYKNEETETALPASPRQNNTKPYYRYKGYYYPKTDEKKEHYPVSLWFGRDEIAICFTGVEDAKVRKVFSLYVAEGDINQSMLTKKIENYALMPFWSPPETSKGNKLQIAPGLLKIGFFHAYYGFSLDHSGFNKTDLPGSLYRQADVQDNGKHLGIHSSLPAEEVNLEENAKYADIWHVTKTADITCEKINFIKILLDFLFELEYANTFEDKNFFHLQPHLQNNLVLDALTKKSRYLLELDALRSFTAEKRNHLLPKKFRDAEKAWFNVCRLPEYKSVFTSPNSLFDIPEKEVEAAIFKTRIGEGRKKRIFYLQNKEGSELRNEICTFFMRKYSIFNAFRTLLPVGGVMAFLAIILFIPLGDFFFGNGPHSGQMYTWYPTGFSTIVLPALILLSLPFYFLFRGINLFKLLLPRLMLGIMVGWAFFWGTEELWKRALSAEWSSVLLVNGCMLTLLFLYVFTDIGNHVYQRTGRNTFGNSAKKTLYLLGMACIVSFVMGHYVIQFFAAPMLENSDFLQHQLLYDANYAPSESEAYPRLNCFFDPSACRDTEGADVTGQKITVAGGESQGQPTGTEKEICSAEDRVQAVLLERIKYFVPEWEWENYSARNVKYFHGQIIYIWSVLFSQFVVSILMGAILQMIWEDRPITEPL